MNRMTTSVQDNSFCTLSPVKGFSFLASLMSQCVFKECPIPLRWICLLLFFLIPFLTTASAQDNPKEPEKKPVYWGDLTIDGQIRVRGEYRNGQGRLRDKGEKPAMFINERARLGIGWERNFLSLKFSAQHTGVWGDQSQTNNKGTVSINEAWAQAKFLQGCFVQIGRQALSYDDERLFGALDWAVTGRSHDALKFGYNGSKHQVHGVVSFNQNAENTIGGTYYNNIATYKNMQMLWYHYSGSNSPFQASVLAMNQGVEDVSATDNSNSKTHYMQTFGTHLTYKGGPLGAHASAYFQTGKDKTGTCVGAWMVSAAVNYKVA
ncbi:MAG: hypothetical protein HUK08_09655, partial [Bacteroidaceae bacterium]|nr:hypothetical protein [Bacteroidaceae bacterium]